MSLKEQIQDAVKAAMRARETGRLETLRMLSAAIKQREVDERKELSDSDVLAVVEKQVKQRRDAIDQYQQGGREELAAAEQAEIDILQTFLPEQLSDDEILAFIDAAIAATGADSMKDMGKVMGQLKPQLAGRADMGAVSGLIKAKLAG